MSVADATYHYNRTQDDPDLNARNGGYIEHEHIDGECAKCKKNLCQCEPTCGPSCKCRINRRKVKHVR